uniref:Uncharacterized protein n=1 Tax=Rhizophora mucronata TaxID=61149 RepID=A0A2P2IIV5_RHIMU
MRIIVHDIFGLLSRNHLRKQFYYCCLVGQRT